MAEEATEQKPVRFGGLTASEAGRRGAEARKRTLAKRAETAAHATERGPRTPLDALRDLMHADPDAYAAGLAKLVQAGDPRSITIMRELFQADKAVRIPRAEETIRSLSPEERRALLLELEARGCGLPEPGQPLESSVDSSTLPLDGHESDAKATLPHESIDEVTTQGDASTSAVGTRDSASNP